MPYLYPFFLNNLNCLKCHNIHLLGYQYKWTEYLWSILKYYVENMTPMFKEKKTKLNFPAYSGAFKSHQIKMYSYIHIFKTTTVDQSAEHA